MCGGRETGTCACLRVCVHSCAQRKTDGVNRRERGWHRAGQIHSTEEEGNTNNSSEAPDTGGESIEGLQGRELWAQWKNTKKNTRRREATWRAGSTRREEGEKGSEESTRNGRGANRKWGEGWGVTRQECEQPRAQGEGGGERTTDRKRKEKKGCVTQSSGTHTHTQAQTQTPTHRHNGARPQTHGKLEGKKRREKNEEQLIDWPRWLE